MIAAWMVYALLTHAILGVAALAFEQWSRQRGVATRWAWVSAMLAPAALPLLTVDLRMTAPGPLNAADEQLVASAPALIDPAALELAVVSARWDGVLLAAWVMSSAGLALVTLASWWRLRRQSLHWPAATLLGQPVHLAVAAGPAVFGVLRPRIVVPRWLLSADRATQRAVIQHEREHLAAGDSRLLAATMLLVIAMPWNLVLWQLWRRLRAAVEIDCDARVLRAGLEAHRYAATLLEVAERRGTAPWHAAAMQGPGGLEQRVRLLLRQRRLSGTGAVVLLLCVAALCVTAVLIDAPPLHSSADTRRANPAQRALSIELLRASEVAEVARLIQAGADVDYVARGDGSPLIVAARRGRLQIVRLLLDNGAAVDLAARGDGNALIMAAARGHRDVVLELLARGADVDAVVIGDETALINAARNGHLSIVRDLVEHGADVRLTVAADRWPMAERRSPLSEATKYGRAAVIDYLHAHGAG